MMRQNRYIQLHNHEEQHWNIGTIRTLEDSNTQTFGLKHPERKQIM